MKNTGIIELLAPARDRPCGITAVNCGADAVYIGAPKFGARAAASNTLEEIAQLIRYAHLYRARVYIALNTILRDNEIDDAVRIVHSVWNEGADGLIIQDMGLLECDLPPIPLIASTQCHNADPQHVAFLEKTGFVRAILARELSIEQIGVIRRSAPSIELESFIHGALCVCYSGRCYMSHAIGGRSGNRGECAQPCRKKYSLADENGKILSDGRYLLSTADLNLSDRIDSLLDAGITSLKIEGRLKDELYIKTIVTHYRKIIDTAIRARMLSRSSDGKVMNSIDVHQAKVFNRGFTEYFINGKRNRIGSINSPKFAGEPVGIVTKSGPGWFSLSKEDELHVGDGISWFDATNQLTGSSIDRIESGKVFIRDRAAIDAGTKIFRNDDRRYNSMVGKWNPRRSIPLKILLIIEENRIILTASDQIGSEAEVSIEGPFDIAEKQQQARDTLIRQIGKLADTEFYAEEILLTDNGMLVPFIPTAQINALRRDLAEKLRAVREKNIPRRENILRPNEEPYPVKNLTFEWNVLNRFARAFYLRHGVQSIEPAAESGIPMNGRKVMTTKHCLRYELGICAGGSPVEPLVLVDEKGKQYRVIFDCEQCRMEIIF